MSGLQDTMNKFNQWVEQYKKQVAANKANPFFNKDNTPTDWLFNKVPADIKKRGIIEGLHDLTYPVLENPYIEPITEPLVGNIRVANYKAGKPISEVNALLGQENNQTSVSFLQPLFSALQQAQQMVHRKKQEPVHIIGSTLLGQDLYSDGYVQETEYSKNLQDKLALLQKNLLQQVSYTPEAKQYLQSIPLRLSANEPGSGAYHYGNNQQPYISINPQTFNSGAAWPATVLAHEYGHALDAKLNDANKSTQNVQKPNLQTSADFYQSFLDNTTNPDNRRLKDYINDYEYFLRSTSKDKRPMTTQKKDTEGYAEYGAIKGDQTLLTPMSTYYSNTYLPQSQNINQSPVFPTESNLYRIKFPK